MAETLDARSRAMLFHLEAFDKAWGGKCISFDTKDRPDRERERGLVIGHDGPVWIDGKWRRSHHALFGWGCVIIESSVGSRRHVDPALLINVTDITDEWCPYDCDEGWLTSRMGADGCPLYETMDGPEYEVICPVHRADDRERAADLYHMEWEQMTEADEAELYALTTRKVAA